MRMPILIVATALLSGCATGGDLTLAQQQQIRQEIQLATDSLLARAARTDTDAVFGMYDPAVLHIDGGALQTVEQLRGTYGPLYEQFDRVEFTLARSGLHVLGPDTGIWIGEGTFRAFEADTVGLSGSAAWTIVWNRDEAGEWRLLHMHQASTTDQTAM